MCIRDRPEDKEWISSERDRCLLTGAWTRATSFEYVSRAFVVTHNGKRRLVFNLKYINSFCKKQGVQYGSLSILRRMMREDDWMWSIDLSDAYHHVGVHPSCQKYFTFAIETDCPPPPLDSRRAWPRVRPPARRRPAPPLLPRAISLP